MNWPRIQEAVGRVWGTTTTLVLAISVAVLPVLDGIDQQFVQAHPQIKTAAVILGLVAAVARVLAPPPPSVPIHIDDAVHVDRDAGTVTVVKATDIPSNVVTKAAGSS